MDVVVTKLSVETPAVTHSRLNALKKLKKDIAFAESELRKSNCLLLSEKKKKIASPPKKDIFFLSDKERNNVGNSRAVENPILNAFLT